MEETMMLPWSFWYFLKSFLMISNIDLALRFLIIMYAQG
jgi:hypothetical protein